MNIIRLIFLLGIFLMSAHDGTAQILSKAERQRAIDSLQSSNEVTKKLSLDLIKKHNIGEALRTLEQNIWRQVDISLKIDFLEAMQQLGSSDFQQDAHRIIDSADIYANNLSLIDSLQIKVKVALLLSNIGDYSAINFVFELLDRDSTIVDEWALDLLKKLIINEPRYATKAKQELLRISKTNQGLSSSKAFNNYLELFGDKATSDIVSIAVHDTDANNRWLALENLLKNNYPQLHELLLNRLYNDPEPLMRFYIADTLLFRYGTISDYIAVTNYFNSDTDFNILFLKDYQVIFRPPAPPIWSPISTMIDTLMSQKHQAASLGWVGDQNFVTDLDGGLDSAKSYIGAGDSIKCYRQIKSVQDIIDNVYHHPDSSQHKHVTIEAWKFLYYNAQYILDRLPGKK